MKKKNSVGVPNLAYVESEGNGAKKATSSTTKVNPMQGPKL